MSTLAPSVGHLSLEDYFLDIITEGEAGWVLHLPDKLSAHQTELEELLGRVFSCRPRSRENFALAQQLSLNWCFSKLRQSGLSIEDCWQKKR